MGQCGGHSRFADETVAVTRHGGERGWEEFDRHRAFERYVPRQVHDPHPPATKLAVEGIAAGDGALEGDELWSCDG